MKRKDYIDMMLSEYKITHIEGLTKISVRTNFNVNTYGRGNNLVAFKIKMVGTENTILIVTKGHTTRLFEQCVFVPYDRNDKSITTFYQEIAIWNKLLKQKQSLNKLIAKI